MARPFLKTKRGRTKVHALWCADHRAQIHYSQRRPTFTSKHRPDHDFSTDCSGFVTLLYRWAGRKNPNGNIPWNGLGYTGTLLGYMKHIPRSEARTGDLVVFGASPGTHVVVLIESARHRKDPLCVSHGQESGPVVVPLSVEEMYHRVRPVTFLKMP